LFDSNLAPRLAQRVAHLFPGSAHVRAFDLGGSDRAIWEFAGRDGFVIVSKDTDFYHLSTVYGAPPKVVWLKVGNAGTDVIADLLLGQAISLEVFADDAQAALLILSLAS
jgi:predicted nuclease of predicted toxin-antitoxin system